ncbi:MAG: hypothetical protein AB7Q29_04880 [Vicinamibacterales bacterium]
MLNWRRALALASLAFFASSTALWAQPEARKLTKDEEREVKAITAAMGAAVSGKPVSNDLGLTWVRADALQAQGDMNIVAFGVTVDPAKVGSGNLMLAWRVLPVDENADPKAKKKAPEPIFENLSSVTIPPGQTAPVFVARLFPAPAGKVDVLVGAKEVGDGKSKASASLIRETVTVPSLAGGDFMLSNVYVFRPRKYDAPLANVMEHPYGSTEEETLPIAAPSLKKDERLRLSGFVFNSTGNVTCEYVMYKEGQQEPFKKYAPADIDPKRSGIPDGLPLTDFEPGKYRLEIKVTDKGTGKTATQNVNFEVVS